MTKRKIWTAADLAYTIAHFATAQPAALAKHFGVTTAALITRAAKWRAEGHPVPLLKGVPVGAVSRIGGGKRGKQLRIKTDDGWKYAGMAQPKCVRRTPEEKEQRNKEQQRARNAKRAAKQKPKPAKPPKPVKVVKAPVVFRAPKRAPKPEPVPLKVREFNPATHTRIYDTARRCWVERKRIAA